MNKQSYLFFNYKGQLFSLPWWMPTSIFRIVEVGKKLEVKKKWKYAAHICTWQGAMPSRHGTCLKTPLFLVQRNLALSPMSLWPSFSEEIYLGAKQRSEESLQLQAFQCQENG